MDDPFWTNQKFAVVGIALAFLGVAVGIGQWLIPPDQLRGEIKFGLIVLACTLAMVGCGLLVQAFLPPATNPTKRLVAAIRVCAVLGLIGIIGYNQFPIKTTPIPAVIPKTEPQSPAPAPTATPSEPAPPFHEKVEPIPSVKPIPRKAKQPVTKKDVPIKLKEIIPDKPIETAPIEATPIQPKEKLADILIRKYPATDPALERRPKFFIREWLHVINRVNDAMTKHDLQTVLRIRPRLRDYISDSAHLAEALFTLRCLESEGYMRITETSERIQGYPGVVNNLEFEFVPERLNEFIEGL